MKVLYVGNRWKFMSANAGYDRIANNPNCDYLCSDSLPFADAKTRVGKRLSQMLLDYKARKLRKNYDIVHYFYGDIIIRFAYKKNAAHKIVASIHLKMDENRWRQKQFIKILENIDGVIVLSKEQEKYVRNKYPKMNVACIPHGFDAPKYNFNNSVLNKSGIDCSDKVNLVFSGRTYRDYEMFDYAVHNCPENVIFHAMNQSHEFKEKYKNIPNVIAYDWLSDEDFYSMIQACDYSFLPLTFATANNTLMEAQNIGTPTILPDINDGIKDYAAPYPENLFYSSKEDLRKILFSLEKKNTKSESLKKFAEKFCWNAVYDQLNAFYESLGKK